ncbi:hypothetical protein M8J76_005844 [Diaphorina citri]|nr:hypothetical protein M8J75_016403 [Diaphorina citri]KAI5744851.1 hypothetical protein M8J76_005844 [Diaphorina citri]
MGRKKEKKPKDSSSTTTMTYVSDNGDVKVVPIDMLTEHVKEEPEDEEEESKSSKKQNQCHLCQKVLKNKHVLKAHITTVHGDKSFQCDECDMSFGTHQALGRHKQCKHMDISLRPFPCDLCEQRFLNKSHLAYHVKTHTGERDVTCGLCFQSFYSKADLVRHMKGRHLNIRSFTCHLCNKGFFRKSYLKVHLLTIHMQPADEAQNAIHRCYACRYCKKIFNSRTTCYTHERSHSGDGEQRSLCMICGKTFSRPSSLKKHLEIHNGPPSLKCPYCDRPFYHLSSYKRHLNIHNRPDPDVCQVCGTLFTNRDAFRRHLRKHVARGDLASLPPPDREEPRISKMQALISRGVDLDEIMKTCKVEVVELGGKSTQGRSRDKAVDALIAKEEKNNWMLEVDELNNSIRCATRQDFEPKTEINWDEPTAPVPDIFTVESLDYLNDKCYTVISNDFKSIVKNNIIEEDVLGMYECFDFSKFTKPSLIFTLKLSSACDSFENDMSLTATDIILPRDVNVELFSTVTEIEIPNYVEEIPEIKPYLVGRELFPYEEIEEIDIDEIDMSGDVFSIHRALERNLQETLKPVEIIQRFTSVEIGRGFEDFHANIHSTITHLGITQYEYDFRNFRDPKRSIVEWTDEELHQKIAHVLNGKTRVFWIKNLYNMKDDCKEIDELVNAPFKYEERDEEDDVSPGMDDYTYEDMVEPSEHQTDSEPDVKPNVEDLSEPPRVSEAEVTDDNKENRKRKKRKRKRKRIKSESDTESEYETRRRKSKKKKKTRKKKKKTRNVKIEIKEEEGELVMEEKPVIHVIKTLCTEFICSYCDKRCSTKGTLKTHIFSMHMMEKACSCHLCGMSFIAKSRLEAHIENVHLRIRNYQCASCEWAFYSRADLERHERRHTGVKPFMCHLCSKTFVRKAQLKSHIVIHSGERKFMCNMCGKSFATRSTLVTHLKRHALRPNVRFYKTPGQDAPKRAKGEPIMCTQCGKSLSTPHSLKRHVEIVHDKTKAKPRVQKAFQCPHCPLSFGYKTSMQRHMHKAHKRFKEPRNHSCPVCGRRLLNEACVLRHMVKRHPYNCDNIDAMNAAVAKAHQRTIPCFLCKRKFLKQSGLQKHMVQKHYYKSEEFESMQYTAPSQELYPDMEEKPNLLLL